MKLLHIDCKRPAARPVRRLIQVAAVGRSGNNLSIRLFGQAERFSSVSLSHAYGRSDSTARCQEARPSPSSVQIVLASPEGGQPPLDPTSKELAFQTDDTRRFGADAQATAQLATTVRLDGVNLADFDRVFYLGWHGPLWGLAENKRSISPIKSFLATPKPVALACPAPGVLRHVKKPDGRPLSKARKSLASPIPSTTGVRNESNWL
jgi:hypothetical protein